VYPKILFKKEISLGSTTKRIISFFSSKINEITSSREMFFFALSILLKISPSFSNRK